MKTLRSPRLLVVGVIIATIFVGFNVDLKTGQAQDGGGNTSPYPAPEASGQTPVMAYPIPGTDLQPPATPFPTPEEAKPAVLTDLEGTYLAEVDGQTVLIHDQAGARRQDAEEYAKYFGVSLEEALYRLDFQEAVGKLGAELTEKEKATFAGIWIQHEPDFRVIVRFTERGSETISAYVSDSPLAKLIEVRSASVSLAHLIEYQKVLEETLMRSEITYILEVDEVDNKLNLMTPELSRLNSILADSRIVLPEFVKVKEGERTVTPQALIYGGLDAQHDCNGTYFDGTTGFNIYRDLYLSLELQN